MRVSRGFRSTGRMVGGKPEMAPSGCRQRGIRHGWEFLTVGGRRYCLGCLFDVLGPQPIYYTGSPHAETILGAGVVPLSE